VAAHTRVKLMDALRLPARAARHVAWRVGRVTTMTLDAMRRGDRTVITTPQAGLRFGNWLYVWLQAHQRSAAGDRTVILEAPGMDLWLEAFPALRGLTVSRDLVRFHDRREWDTGPYWWQRFGIDFTRESLDAFIRDCLAPYIQPDQSRTLVVNLRRGDFYNDPGHAEVRGFDQLGFLREALARAGYAQRALVVSDDVVWCREHTRDLMLSSADSVEFAETDPIANFKAVASAERIIGTNSTFTYWAAYVCGFLHDSPLIVMPRFHARMTHGTDAYQLDPDWIAIDGYW
jgi:hypothetical protein